MYLKMCSDVCAHIVGCETVFTSTRTIGVEHEQRHGNVF